MPDEMVKVEAAEVERREAAPWEDEMEQAVRVAEILAATGRFGDTPQEVFAKMQVAEGYGLPVGPTLRHGIHDVEGRLSLHYTLVATLLRRGGYDYAVNELSSTVCEVVLLRRQPDGQLQVAANPVTGQPYTVRVTMQEMVERRVALGKDGRSLKSAWASYPQRMLFSHAINELVSVYAPEVLYLDGAERIPSIAVELEEEGIEEENTGKEASKS